MRLSHFGGGQPGGPRFRPLSPRRSREPHNRDVRLTSTRASGGLRLGRPWASLPSATIPRGIPRSAGISLRAECQTLSGVRRHRVYASGVRGEGGAGTRRAVQEGARNLKIRQLIDVVSGSRRGRDGRRSRRITVGRGTRQPSRSSRPEHAGGSSRLSGERLKHGPSSGGFCGVGWTISGSTTLRTRVDEVVIRGTSCKEHAPH